MQIPGLVITMNASSGLLVNIVSMAKQQNSALRAKSQEVNLHSPDSSEIG